MSDLTFREKRAFEQLLGMETGFVLDFTNQTFEELVRDTTGPEIYNARYLYKSGSKANRLRAFWQKENNATVGKLMGGILDYRGGESALDKKCRLIVQRLLGDGNATTATSIKPEDQQKAAEELRRSGVLGQLKEDFFQLTAQSNRNAAGLALEKLLNRLFDEFGLKPRKPFRVVGEQIDGSFVLGDQIYLLESKWEKEALPEADLLVFRGKIEGKSTFTRGVFIALNDITGPALHAITQGKAPSFFVMNGHDLLMILSEQISLTNFLQMRIRLLAEEGSVCVPFSALV